MVSLERESIGKRKTERDKAGKYGAGSLSESGILKFSIALSL